MQATDVEELRRIWSLKQDGAITDNEYLMLKADILGQKDEIGGSSVRDERAPTKASAPPGAEAIGVSARPAGPPGPSYRTIATVTILVVIALFVIVGLAGPQNRPTNKNASANFQTADTPQTTELSPKERKRQIKVTLAELKKLPAADVNGNNLLYSKLFELDPTNAKFERMRENYEKRIAAEGLAPGLPSSVASNSSSVNSTSGSFHWPHFRSNMQRIEDRVASDAVHEYEIAARQGNRMQICVQAGMVAAAYLQAQDEPDYRTWKSRERLDCSRAGVPND